MMRPAQSTRSGAARPSTRRSVRRAGPLAAAVLALTLSGCSGDGSDEVTAAPDNATETDFCEAYTSLQDRIFSDIDLDASQEEQAQKVADAIKGWASDLADAGTPDGTPEQAREGYEALVESLQDLPDDVSTEDLQNLEDSLNEQQQAAAEDFTSYADDLCPASIPTDLPSDLQSQLDDLGDDLPSELPSDLPSDLLSDLPSDLPSDLLEDLPSDFPSDALPSDFPSSLLESQ